MNYDVHWSLRHIEQRAGIVCYEEMHIPVYKIP